MELDPLVSILGAHCGRGRQVQMQRASGSWMSKQIIQFISKHGLPSQLPKEITLHAADIAKHVFHGQHSVFDEPAYNMLYVTHPPRLPLSTKKWRQLKSILEDCNLPVELLTLFEVLGLKTYATLSEIAGGQSNEKARRKIERFRSQFCRHWLIGYLSQANKFICKTELTYTSDEFVTKMQELQNALQTHGQKSSQTSFTLKFTSTMVAIEILLQLWQQETAQEFLQNHCCYHLSMLDPFLRKAISRETLHQGIRTFVDFIKCIFVNTPYGPLHQDHDLLSGLDHLKRQYAALDQILLSERHLSIQAQQSRTLQIFLQHVEAKRQHVAATAELQGALDAKDPKFHKKMLHHINLATHQSIYIKLFANAMYFLEDYARDLLPSHVTIHARLTRVDVINKIFCKRILDVEAFHLGKQQYQQRVQKQIPLHRFPESGLFTQLKGGEIKWLLASLERADIPGDMKAFIQKILNKMDAGEHLTEKPSQELLTAEELIWVVHAINLESAGCALVYETELDFLTDQARGELLKVVTSMARSVYELIGVDPELTQYACDRVFTKELNRTWWVLQEHETFYPVFTRFLESVYTTLVTLEKMHGEQLFALIEEHFSRDACREHKNTLFDFVRKLACELMLPLGLVAVLHRDMAILTGHGAQAQSQPSFHKQLTVYLSMQTFKRAFYAKIAPQPIPKVPVAQTPRSPNFGPMRVFKIPNGAKIREVMELFKEFDFRESHFQGGHVVVQHQYTPELKLNFSVHKDHLSPGAQAFLERKMYGYVQVQADEKQKK